MRGRRRKRGKRMASGELEGEKRNEEIRDSREWKFKKWLNKRG